MSKRIGLLCCSIIGLFFTSSLAVDLSTTNENLKLSIDAAGWFYFGQVAHGTGGSATGTEKKIWTDNAFAGLSVAAEFDKRLKLVLGIETEMKNSWPIVSSNAQTKTGQTSVAVRDAYGLYSLDGKAGILQICAGYFPYKYNPDVRNLGEYMFRSGTYPAYIKTDFDYPLAKLLGLRTGYVTPDSSLNIDLILNTERVSYPVMDWTLSGVFNYDILNRGLVNIGAGISFAHLLSVYDSSTFGSATSPKNKLNQYVDADGDTAYYTFKGTKLMVRTTIDPLVFVRKDSDVFGKNDLKFYGELLVIGLKSYPDTTASGGSNPSYSDWKEKAPVTFGINLPTFKLLDLLNLEFEYWGSKYYNDYTQIYGSQNLPIAPGLNEGVSESKWKWSLYLKKSFYRDHCAITAQFARDHMRLYNVDYNHANYREETFQAGDWWWATKLSFSF
jgi:hypothetical protein